MLWRNLCETQTQMEIIIDRPNWANLQYCEDIYVESKPKWKLSLILDVK